MSLNSTPSANRIHIGFFGKRNAGKSSIVNAVTGQELAIVSDVLGTTTDPVLKAMELMPLGPVVIIDTPGIDDEGDLGEMRVNKTKQILNKTDIAVLVTDATVGVSAEDNELVTIFKEKEIPYIIVFNKCDLVENYKPTAYNEIYVSAKDKININELKEKIALLSKNDEDKPQLVSDIINKNDFVVLVTPIDASAPKGRLILPQQQTIRDILDSGATAIVVKETELEDTLNHLGKKPSLVITDSQVFGKVSKIVPKDIKLTSFSILMARFKGLLKDAVKGVVNLENLKDGDTVLISEGCTHHRQCEDIGTVKLPKWIEEYTGKSLNFEFSSGTGFPDDLSGYALVVHCGGCMINEREMKYRAKYAKGQNIPFTNYGIAIAYINGILKRSVEVFPDISAEIKNS